MSKRKQRGTIVLDRILRGVGRIKKATGTHDRRTARRLNEMLTSLHGAGRLDVLEQIRDGNLHLLQAYRHYRTGHWDDIPTAQHLQPLGPTLADWAESYPCSDKHRESMQRSFQAISGATHKAATVNDLPAALVRFRKRCMKAGHARTFNLARSAAQAFLRSTAGRHDRLWLAVATVEPLPVTPRFTAHPQTVNDARAIAERLGKKAGPMWWTLCTTGMNPKEYFEDGFDVRDERILIRGRKRQGRNRFVPLVAVPVRPMLTRWGFRQALRRLSHGVTPRDGRTTYANWLEAAGIPRTRRRLYLGHGARDVTDLYEQHDVVAFLAADGAKIRALLAEGRRHLRVVK